MELYKPFKSKAKNKKYSVYVKGGKLIHFGDKRYGQYKDKIGLYSHLDHNDKKKRESYHSRFGPWQPATKILLSIGRTKYCGN